MCMLWMCSFEFEVLESDELGPLPCISKLNFDPCCISIKAKLHDYSLPCFYLLLFPVKCNAKHYPGMTCTSPALCLQVLFNVTLISVHDIPEHYVRSQIALWDSLWQTAAPALPSSAPNLTFPIPRRRSLSAPLVVWVLLCFVLCISQNNIPI